jgi:hypothetical protein
MMNNYPAKLRGWKTFSIRGIKAKKVWWERTRLKRPCLERRWLETAWLKIP